MSDGNGGVWKTVAGWVASILLGAAGLTYGIGGSQGRAEVSALAARQDAAERRADEAREDMREVKTDMKGLARTMQRVEKVLDALIPPVREPRRPRATAGSGGGK